MLSRRSLLDRAKHTLFSYVRGINKGKYRQIRIKFEHLLSEESLQYLEQTYTLLEGGEFDWRAFNISFELPSNTLMLSIEHLSPRPIRFSRLSILHKK